MVLFTDAVGIGIYTAKWSPGLRTQRDVNILISTEISITPVKYHSRCEAMSAILVFPVKFNVELSSQVMNVFEQHKLKTK